MYNEDFIPKISDEQQRRYKDQMSRYGHYLRWLDMTGEMWFSPDLQAYLAFLIGLGTLQPATIKARIAVVRSRYRQILNDPQALKDLQNTLRGSAYEFNKCIPLMRIAADPRNTKFSFKLTTRSYAQLTAHQSSKFLTTPDPNTPYGLRDLAIIAIMMFMGLRETEVRLLTVECLLFTGGEGQVGIYVPQGPASTERFVPSYEAFPVQKILEAWLSKSGITEGPVFRGFYKTQKHMRETPITVQAIEDIFRLYPLTDGDEPLYIKPVDLRIFYAQMLYRLDYTLDVISKNLGVQIQTAVNYIGTPSKSDEEPIPMFNLKKLEAQYGESTSL